MFIAIHLIEARRLIEAKRLIEARRLIEIGVYTRKYGNSTSSKHVFVRVSITITIELSYTMLKTKSVNNYMWRAGVQTTFTNFHSPQ